MKPRRDQAFTVICVLVLATVLFSLVSLSLAAGYRLHRQNQQVLAVLQERADHLGHRP